MDKKFLDDMWKKLEPDEPIPTNHDLGAPISIKRAVKLGLIKISPKSKYFTETGEKKEENEETNSKKKDKDI